MARARHTRGRPLHGLLLVDKPAGASSNRVLQQVRTSLDARKAGHAGTLDPLATGMLPVLLGEATKLAGHLLDADKAYETELVLGVETDSLDADGTVRRRRAVPPLERTALEALLAEFTGEQWQTPPMVSAIKVDGRRLYDIAREGGSVEREPRRVTIHSIELLGSGSDSLRLAVRCSKGTYIRTLGADLGERLGCGAHVRTLRRRWVAPFMDAPMHDLATIEREGEALLLPLDAGLDHLPAVAVDGDGLRSIRHGQSAPLVAPTDPPTGSANGSANGMPSENDPAARSGWQDAPVLRVYGPTGELVALGAPDRLRDGRVAVRPSRVLQLDTA